MAQLSKTIKRADVNTATGLAGILGAMCERYPWNMDLKLAVRGLNDFIGHMRVELGESLVVLPEEPGK